MHANRKDENGSVIGARITVPTDAVPTLTSRSFWPRPAYARRWNFTPPPNLRTWKKQTTSMIQLQTPQTRT